MLNKRIIGRLGNQMFQYAAVRAFQEKYAKDDQINIDFSDTFQYLDKGNRPDLLDFKIKKCKLTPAKKTITQKIILKYLLEDEDAENIKKYEELFEHNN